MRVYGTIVYIAVLCSSTMVKLKKVVVLFLGLLYCIRTYKAFKNWKRERLGTRLVKVREFPYAFHQEQAMQSTLI